MMQATSDMAQTSKNGPTLCLLLAAGAGHRARSSARNDGGLPKQYRNYKHEPVLRRTARRFLQHPAIDGLQIVIGADHLALYEKALGPDVLGHAKVLDAVAGGASRGESAWLGLRAAQQAGDWSHILIHDAARPDISAAAISSLYKALSFHDAVALAAPAHESIVRSDARAGGNVIDTHLERAGLWCMQTPQAFVFARILAAYENMRGHFEKCVDDAYAARQAGMEVFLIENPQPNDKLTRNADFDRSLPADLRIGHGFDAHAFAPSRPLILCGISIPHDKGLAGHSDADVGLHALTDAILGCFAGGDLGQIFPSSDDKWRDADSSLFVTHVLQLLHEAGGRLAHADITLIAQEPRLAPSIDAMRHRSATLCGLELQRLSIKATTTDFLGFTGRKEGIAAFAHAGAWFS